MRSRLQALSQVLLSAGDCNKALREAPAIEPSASDQDAQPVAAPNVLHYAERGPPESSGRVVRSRFGDVDEVMGDAFAIGRRGFVGPYVQSAVDRHGIAGDDLPAEACGYFQGKCAFACGGGSDDAE